MIYVEVKFTDNGKNYLFACPKHINPEVGKYVVVESTFVGYDYSIAKIVNIFYDDSSKKATNRIVNIVDVDEYLTWKENQAKIELLEKQLEEAIQDTKKLEMFRLFAKNNDTVATLLNEYENCLKKV